MRTNNKDFITWGPWGFTHKNFQFLRGPKKPRDDRIFLQKNSVYISFAKLLVSEENGINYKGKKYSKNIFLCALFMALFFIGYRYIFNKIDSLHNNQKTKTESVF